jgi:uracil-DNA glycosylase family 4
MLVVTRDETIYSLTKEIVGCRACPRLVAWREVGAWTKRPAFASDDYWARPVPGFGDPKAGVLVVGLAPAAHGGNRTGRIFTGDRSGEWLFGSLHRTGFANQSRSVSRDDGLELTGAYVTAPVRCAPPGNKPLPAERDRCFPYLVRELALLENVSVIVALGSFAWDSCLRVAVKLGGDRVRPKPRFGHGAEADLGRYLLLGCYHVSQQNTFTGKLTRDMLDAIFTRAGLLMAKAARPL